MTYWQDEYRVWSNIFPYNCSRKAIVPSTRVWIPDMVIGNSEQQFLPKDRNRDDIIISSDGKSGRTVSGTITFYCPLNMAMFPFDVQTCSLIFDSWELDTSQQVFKSYNTGTYLLSGFSNEEWDVTDFTLKITNTSFSTVFYSGVRRNEFQSSHSKFLIFSRLVSQLF